MEVGGRHALATLIHDRDGIGEGLLDIAARLRGHEPVLEPWSGVKRPGGLRLACRGGIAAEPVQETRLADIRATDDRDTHLSGVRLELFGRRWQLLDDRVEEVPGCGALEPGDGEEIAEAELVEFRRLRLGAP